MIRNTAGRSAQGIDERKGINEEGRKENSGPRWKMLIAHSVTLRTRSQRTRNVTSILLCMDPIRDSSVV